CHRLRATRSQVTAYSWRTPQAKESPPVRGPELTSTTVDTHRSLLQCSTSQSPSEDPSYQPERDQEAAGPSHSHHPKAEFLIREATPNDCADLLRLIKELANYEKKPHAVQITERDLLEDGFGERPCYRCLIAELPNPSDNGCSAKVGFAMYYLTYDPWVGKTLHLENFFVMALYRGIGSEILKKISQEALEQRCRAVYFMALRWNTPSIGYYKRRGAQDLSDAEGWRLFSFSEEDIRRLAAGASQRDPVSQLISEEL
ncbi:diamine acetyltransferase 1-like, partial [Pseudophryne corroboree]|uniref:diamine acetyltransferase 1-like n=1 Tax=Pseudophryne corroboree TaxID=495146 RepID=UPI003081B523